MTFEPTGDTCALLLVGVACAFEMDGRPCATKCEKDGKAYVERVPGVSEVLNTSPNVRIYGHFM